MKGAGDCPEPRGLRRLHPGPGPPVAAHPTRLFRPPSGRTAAHRPTGQPLPAGALQGRCCLRNWPKFSSKALQSAKGAGKKYFPDNSAGKILQNFFEKVFMVRTLHKYTGAGTAIFTNFRNLRFIYFHIMSLESLKCLFFL